MRILVLTEIFPFEISVVVSIIGLAFLQASLSIN